MIFKVGPAGVSDEKLGFSCVASPTGIEPVFYA